MHERYHLFWKTLLIVGDVKPIHVTGMNFLDLVDNFVYEAPIAVSLRLLAKI